jgi:hypothetical protein
MAFWAIMILVPAKHSQWFLAMKLRHNYDYLSGVHGPPPCSISVGQRIAYITLLVTLRWSLTISDTDSQKYSCGDIHLHREQVSP